MVRLFYRVCLYALRLPVWILSPQLCTHMTAWLLTRLGVDVRGTPNYLSAKIWFDGGDYTLITIGHGVTISSNVRLLTHDWAPYTAARAIFGDSIDVRGRRAPVVLEDYAFVGTGSILLPGAKIGRGAVVGAGSVVRGNVPEGAIVRGNPASQVGSASELVKRNYPERYE